MSSPSGKYGVASIQRNDCILSTYCVEGEAARQAGNWSGGLLLGLDLYGYPTSFMKLTMMDAMAKFLLVKSQEPWFFPLKCISMVVVVDHCR